MLSCPQLDALIWFPSHAHQSWARSGKESQIRTALRPVRVRGNFGEALDYAATLTAASMTLSQYFLGLLQHRPGVAHLELAWAFDVQRLDHTVDDQHRVTVVAQAHAARRQVQRQPGGLGEIGAAVGHHADLARGVLIAAPGAHHE